MKNKVLQNKKYYQSRIRALLGELDMSQCSILDLGCGEMLLKQNLKANDIRYKGIDFYSFQNDPDFYRGDILSYSMDLEIYDFIILLGVLDHMDYCDQLGILDKIQNRFQKGLVLSRWNHTNLILRLLHFRKESVDIDSRYKGFALKKLALLKFPGLKLLWKIGEDNFLCKLIATEYIYIIRPLVR